MRQFPVLLVLIPYKPQQSSDIERYLILRLKALDAVSIVPVCASIAQQQGEVSPPHPELAADVLQLIPGHGVANIRWQSTLRVN